jgi:hypothetical protein
VLSTLRLNSALSSTKSIRTAPLTWVELFITYSWPHVCVQKQQAGQRSPGQSRKEAAAPALLGEALSDEEIRRQKNLASIKLQARGRGMIERKIVQGKKAAGELPGQNRLLAHLKEIPTSTKSISGQDEMVLSISPPSGSLSI